MDEAAEHRADQADERAEIAVSTGDQGGQAGSADPTLAPSGEDLVQAQIGLGPAERLDDGVARIERLLDAGYRDWRDRETW